MKFDFLYFVNELSREEKITFYTMLANDLTIATRSIWSDDTIPTTEQVDRMKWINEIMRRVISRLMSLVMNLNLEGEKDVWDAIVHHVSQNKAIGGEVSWAIEYSYDKVVEARNKQEYATAKAGESKK